MKLFDEAARDDLRPIGAILGSPLRTFDPEVASALSLALRDIDTAPKTVAAADRAQQEVTDVLDRYRHPAAAFLKVYHGITVAVIEAMAEGRLGPRFFFDRLPGRFAERHFDGLRAELGLDTSTDAARYELWRPSFALDNLAPDAGSPLGKKPPLAHFTVGMCIHINLDLAVALDETLREFGVQGDATVLEEVERGHNFVDTILAEKVTRSTEQLASELDCPMSKRIIEAGAVGVAGEQSMVTIRRWRAETFPHAVRLSRATSDEERAKIREDVYRAGARRTVRLFNTLPVLIDRTLSGSLWGA
jgi:Family of unknown function (DUF5995)